MKKSMLIMLFITSVITINACKKGKIPEKTPTETNRAKIIAKWNLISFDFEIIEPGKPVKYGKENADKGDYYDFRPDAKVYFVVSGEKEQNAKYIIDNEKLKIEDKPYTIIELTDNKLRLEETQVSSTKSIKQVLNFNK